MIQKRSDNRECDKHQGGNAGLVIEKEHRSASELEDNSHDCRDSRDTRQSPRSESQSDVPDCHIEVREKSESTDNEKERKEHPGQVTLREAHILINHTRLYYCLPILYYRVFLGEKKRGRQPHAQK